MTGRDSSDFLFEYFCLLDSRLVGWANRSALEALIEHVLSLGISLDRFAVGLVKSLLTPNGTWATFDSSLPTESSFKSLLVVSLGVSSGFLDKSFLTPIPLLDVLLLSESLSPRFSNSLASVLDKSFLTPILFLAAKLL